MIEGNRKASEERHQVLLESIPRLSSEETEWLKRMIKREEKKIAFRSAVIEKSLSSLLVTAVLGAIAWITTHFKGN